MAAAAAIAGIAAHATRAEQPPGPLKPIALVLRTDDAGSATLHAFGLGKPFGTDYDIDPSKLTFTARPYAEPEASPLPVEVTMGVPEFVPAVGSGSPPDERLREYAMPLAFGKAPGKPGMYDVGLHAAEGFARAKDGTPLPVGDWSRAPMRWHVLVWWPDESSNDAALSRSRALLAGRDVYGYGGIVIECQPSFLRSYDGATAVHVRSVERERDTLRELYMGKGVGDASPHFFAVDPLRIIVDVPKNVPRGTSGTALASSDRCPKTTLADWQVDVSLSLSPPPDGFFRDAPWGKHLADGMTRDEVVWLLGYPPEFADRATMSAESTWTYDYGPRERWFVAFQRGRVSSFETPAPGP